jgi:hypothetical protein
MASTVILDKNKNITKSIDPVDFGIFSLKSTKRSVVINDILPFRIKLTNIGIPGEGSSNVPGIGIQIIGYSNYIL